MSTHGALTTVDTHTEYNWDISEGPVGPRAVAVHELGYLTL